MIIGELVEGLIRLKKDKKIYYPEDKLINSACNILEQLPKEQDVYEWVEKHKNNTKNI